MLGAQPLLGTFASSGWAARCRTIGWTMTVEPPFRANPRALVVLCAVGLLVRLGALISLREHPSFLHHRLDAALFHDAGVRLASGDFSFGGEVFHMSPLYQGFVGLVYALFGDGPVALRLVQIGLGLVTIVCVYLACGRLFGERWARAGGALAALYGPFVFYEQQLLAETLAGALSAGLLAVALRAERSRDFALGGALLGLSILVRPNALLLVAPLALLARRPRALLALVAAAIAVVAPVTLRNRIVGGEWILVTDAGGLNFFIGNGPGANGTFRIPAEVPDATSAQTQFAAYRRVAEGRAGHAMTARQVDAFWYGEATRHVAAHPLAALRVGAEKVWLTLSARELPNSEDYAFMRTQSLVLAAPMVQLGWLTPLALLGLVQLARGDRRRRAVALGVGCWIAAIAAFFVLGRYRVSLAPWLIVAAVAGARGLAEAWPAPRALALQGVGLGLGAVLALWPKLPKSFADELYKLGYAHQALGQPVPAARAYEDALRLEPEHLSSLNNLASLCEERGDPERARALWRAVERIALLRASSVHVERARRHLESLDRATPAPGVR